MMRRFYRAGQSTTICPAPWRWRRRGRCGWPVKDGVVPTVVDAAYRAAGAPRAVTLGRTSGARREREAVKWLVTGRTTTS